MFWPAIFSISKKLLSLEPTNKVLCISELLHGMTYFCKNEDKAYERFKYFIKHKDKEGNPIQQTIPFNPYQKPWKLDLHGYIPITGKFAIRYCLESVTINGKKFDEDNDVRTLQIITGQGNHSCHLQTGLGIKKTNSIKKDRKSVV